MARSEVGLALGRRHVGGIGNTVAVIGILTIPLQPADRRKLLLRRVEIGGRAVRRFNLVSPGESRVAHAVCRLRGDGGRKFLARSDRLESEILKRGLPLGASRFREGPKTPDT